MFVRAVIVGDGVSDLFCGRGAFQVVVEAAELLLPALFHAPSEYRAVELPSNSRVMCSIQTHLEQFYL
jgi:hypothetical protein